MKTWEMIKELTENPEKKFKVKNAEGTVGITDKRLQWIDGTYIDSNEDLIINEIVLHDLEWEEVKEPVDFMEVLKRIEDSDGDIRLMLINDLYEVEIKNKTFDKVLYNLSIDYLDTSIADILLNGKWYIEED